MKDEGNEIITGNDYKQKVLVNISFKNQTNATSIPSGLMVRIPGFHLESPGSTPGEGGHFFLFPAKSLPSIYPETTN